MNHQYMEKIIIYQVLPRLFGNSTENNVKNGTLSENGVGKLNDFTDKALTEIKRLGCTHIWYTGIIEHATKTDYRNYGIDKDNPYVVKGEAGSPYAIKDYYDIDPDLAFEIPNRMSEFETLIARSRKNGLKVIIDFVPNHVSRQYHSDVKSPDTKEFGEDDDSSIHFSSQNNFYYIPRQELHCQFYTGEGEDQYRENPAKATGNDCFGAYPGINDWYETIKLNYGIDYMHGGEKHFDPIPDTWFKMCDILLFWASKGIDGFRCDMAEMVPVEFWNWVIPQVKKRYPDLIFIAEIYNPQQYRNYIHTGRFDYLYDKVGLYDLLRSITSGHASASQITSAWQSVDDIQAHMLNFLENHDEQRIASDFFARDPRKALPALVVSSTLNTNPFMLYFGQELGEPGMDDEGFSGRDGRTTIFDYWCVKNIRNWVNNGKFGEKRLTPEQRMLRHYYKKILHLCNKEKAIRNGSFFDLMYVNDNRPDFNPYKQYAYLRKAENELLIFIVNFDDCPVDVSVCLPQHAFDVLEISGSDTDEWLFSELIGGETQKDVLSPEKPFRSRVEAHNAVIWKVKLNRRVEKKGKKPNGKN